MTTKSCEIWLVIDEDGDYAVGVDREAAADDYESNIGGSTVRRFVNITVKIAPPRAEHVKVDVGDEVGELVQAEAT